MSLSLSLVHVVIDWRLQQDLHEDRCCTGDKDKMTMVRFWPRVGRHALASAGVGRRELCGGGIFFFF